METLIVGILVLAGLNVAVCLAAMWLLARRPEAASKPIPGAVKLARTHRPPPDLDALRGPRHIAHGLLTEDDLFNPEKQTEDVVYDDTPAITTGKG